MSRTTTISPDPATHSQEATTSYASRTLNGMSTVNRAKRERHPKGEQREEGICELEQLKPLFRYTVSEAADRYGVGLTHFKTICRRNGIDRWPKRKLDSALQVVRHHKQVRRLNRLRGEVRQPAAWHHSAHDHFAGGKHSSGAQGRGGAGGGAEQPHAGPHGRLPQHPSTDVQNNPQRQAPSQVEVCGRPSRTSGLRARRQSKHKTLNRTLCSLTLCVV